VPELSLISLVDVRADHLASWRSVARQVGDKGPPDSVVVTDDGHSRWAAGHVPIEHRQGYLAAWAVCLPS
jgi:hypothetical protein